MIKKIAWEAFKNTGDINTYLELKQIEELEKGIEQPETSQFLNELENTISEQNNNNKLD